MRGGGRFGSDYKRRLAADMAKKKTEKFSSPPPAERQPSTFNRIVEGVKTAARIGEESFYPTYGQVGAPNPLAVLGSPTFRETGIGQSLARTGIGRRLIESQTTMGEVSGGYQGPVSTVGKAFTEPGAGTAVMAGLTLGEFLPGGRGSRAARQGARAFDADIMEESPAVESLIDTLSRQARQAGKGPAPKIEEAPRNIAAFTPTKKDAEGFWQTVERPAIDDVSGQASFDPSEIRSAAFGGVGELVRGTPLESLTDLAVPNKATTIRAIYKPPTAKEILGMMRKTDRAVPSRLKAKRDRLVKQIDEAEDVDTALRLRAELDATTDPKKWKFNEYTLKDAEALRDRWIMASQHFEDAYGVPLPWRLEADYLDEAGNLKTARIFGQDVEHGIPVNKGGKGKADELTLLPTIPNVGRRDYSWDDYAAKYPDEWNNLLDVLYGTAKRY
jgi:hypothetical protein